VKQQLDALVTDLRSLMEDAQTSDVVLVLDCGYELTAHRAILAARSDVFRWAQLFPRGLRALALFSVTPALTRDQLSTEQIHRP